MRTVHDQFTNLLNVNNKGAAKKDHLIHGSVPLPIHPVNLLPHLLYSFCNNTYPSHEEISSKRPFTDIRTSWPYNGTSYFFWLFCVLIIPFENNAHGSFCSQLHSCFYLFHYSVSLHFLCWVVFFHITHVTCYTTPFHPSACENHIVLWSRVPG